MRPLTLDDVRELLPEGWKCFFSLRYGNCIRCTNGYETILIEPGFINPKNWYVSCSYDWAEVIAERLSKHGFAGGE